MNRALGVLLLAAGCCSGPDYRALAGDPAFRIDAAESFALVAPVVDDAARWGFGAPAPAVSALADRYRPPGATPTAALGDVEAAPPPLRDALRRVAAALTAKGYVPATGERADLVVRVGVTTRSGRAERVTLDVGGRVAGAFAPARVAFEARLAADGCGPTAGEAAAHLAAALPPRHQAAGP